VVPSVLYSVTVSLVAWSPSPMVWS